MPVQVQCPNPDCRASFSVSDAELGHPGHCLKCGQAFSLFTTRGSDAPSAGDTDAVWTPLRASELAAGETFGRYRILRRLGRGGMGTVYLAHDSQLERDVALKVPHFAAGESPEVVQRFYREARALARFDHPNICPVFDVGQIDGTLFLTMPYVEGRPLSELVTEPPLPQRRAAEVLRTLARALAETHTRGIVHRDLKPSNVLISPRRELVIMDFGLARRVEASDLRLTKAGSILGTPAYMAPEQITGDIAAMGPGCDIYSLGVILYELLTGRLPFEGPAAVVMGLVMVSEPDPPSKHRPDLDRRLEAICRKAMAKKIPDRYSSMAALTEALDQYLRATAPAGPTPGGTVRQLPPTPWRRLVAAGLAALGLLGIVIWVATDTGTVRIDIQDPNVVVRVDGQEIRIEALDKPLTLRVGDHHLFVTRDDLVFEARTFQVRRHDQTNVAVRYQPKESGVAKAELQPAPMPPAPEKEAAPAPTPVPAKTPEPAPPAVAKVEGKPSSWPLSPSPASPKPSDVAPSLDVGQPAKELTNSLGMKLVLIPAGEFQMGSPDSDSNSNAQTDEKPQHRVRITRAFYLGATEVTVGQFRRFVAATNYRTDAERDGKGGYSLDEKSVTVRDPKFTWQSPGFDQTDEHPVVNVSWNDAVAFCEWLSGQEGQVFRLPTEAEWEYACRARTTTRYWSGEDAETLAAAGNVADATAMEKFPDWTWTIAARDGYVYTAPVGRFRANAWGLYDMHGNVWEWCSDWCDAGYYGQSPVADPDGPVQASDRVIRGGGWYGDPYRARSAYRGRYVPGVRNYDLGFRVARVPSGK